jgi:hypothetical protein
MITFIGLLCGSIGLAILSSATEAGATKALN